MWKLQHVEAEGSEFGKVAVIVRGLGNRQPHDADGERRGGSGKPFAQFLLRMLSRGVVQLRLEDENGLVLVRNLVLRVGKFPRKAVVLFDELVDALGLERQLRFEGFGVATSGG
ncbi:MAG: hypothetical protein M0R06_03845 [Sphaerochaeta sp.]|nr:hypothetical protein [Sphaerochaeta sp.]